MPAKQSAQDKYTNVEMRNEIKQKLMDGDKGGKPGQWSARKAQMMASEYKKRGGEYKTDKSDADDMQKHLQEWTKEEWQTKEGSGNAKQADGTEKRYLPKKAWEELDESEKEETEQLKAEGQQAGEQYVENTKPAKNARKRAQRHDDEEEEAPARKSTRTKKGQTATEADDESASEEDESDEPKPKKGKSAKGKAAASEGGAGAKTSKAKGKKASAKDD